MVERSYKLVLFLFCVPIRINEILCPVSLGPGRTPCNYPIDPNFGLCMVGGLIKMSMGGYFINRTMGLVIGYDTCVRHI